MNDLVATIGEIEFRNVNFTYPVSRGDKANKRALTNINFKIKANSKVAIVGTSRNLPNNLNFLFFRLNIYR